MLAKLINIEGAGGIGKSTCAKYLQERLLYVHKQNVQIVDWLQATAVGRSVKAFFDQEENALGVCSLSWLFMLYAARRQVMEEVIYPLVSTGVHVIVENYYDATHVYLGEMLNLDKNIAQIENLSSVSELRERADHTLFLSCQGNFQLQRVKPFDSNSYPELMEKISYGNRDSINQAWDEHITKVQKDTAHDKTQVHVLDANMLLLDMYPGLDEIAALIAK